MKIWAVCIVGGLICLSFSFPAFSETYKWVDKNGNVVYSDTLPAGSKGQKIEFREDRENQREGKETAGIKESGNTNDVPPPFQGAAGPNESKPQVDGPRGEGKGLY